MLCRLLLLGAALLTPARTSTAGVRHYPSPDRRYTASVTAVSAGTSDAGEGFVEVRRRAGLLCIRRSFVSDDGEHGQIVEKAAWTPDARFFVFTTASSGGHSAWHHWTFVWSRRDDRIHSLDDAYSSPTVAGTTRASFRLTKPDRISTYLLGGMDASEMPSTVSLSRVHWKYGIGAER